MGRAEVPGGSARQRSAGILANPGESQRRFELDADPTTAGWRRPRPCPTSNRARRSARLCCSRTANLESTGKREGASGEFGDAAGRADIYDKRAFAPGTDRANSPLLLPAFRDSL